MYEHKVSGARLSVVYAIWIVLKIERIMFVRALLALVRIELASYHILWLLVHHLMHRHREALVFFFSGPIHC